MSVDCLLVTKPQTPVACAIDKPKFICESLLESLFWAPTCVPGFEHAPSGATLQKLLNRVKLHLLHRPKTTAAVASVIPQGLLPTCISLQHKNYPEGEHQLQSHQYNFMPN